AISSGSPSPDSQTSSILYLRTVDHLLPAGRAHWNALGRCARPKNENAPVEHDCSRGVTVEDLCIQTQTALGAEFSLPTIMAQCPGDFRPRRKLRIGPSRYAAASDVRLLRKPHHTALIRAILR